MSARDEWTEFKTENGEAYYFNSRTQETTWDPPGDFLPFNRRVQSYPKVPFGIVPSLVGRAQTSSGQSIIVKNGEYVVDDVEKGSNVVLKLREKVDFKKCEDEYEKCVALNEWSPNCFVRPFGVLPTGALVSTCDDNEDLSQYCALVLEKGDKSFEQLLLDYSVDEDDATRIADANALTNIVLDASKASIVLMDFKPANVVLFGRHLKGIDFDSSKRVNDVLDQSTLGDFTPDYMAPEVAKLAIGAVPRLFAHPSMDVWSLGAVVFRIFCGASIWDKMVRLPEDPGPEELVQLLCCIDQDRIDRCIENTFTREALRTFLKGALQVDPALRRSAAELKAGYLLRVGGGSVSVKDVLASVQRVQADMNDVKASSLRAAEGLQRVEDGVAGLQCSVDALAGVLGDVQRAISDATLSPSVFAVIEGGATASMYMADLRRLRVALDRALAERGGGGGGGGDGGDGGDIGLVRNLREALMGLIGDIPYCTGTSSSSGSSASVEVMLPVSDTRVVKAIQSALAAIDAALGARVTAVVCDVEDMPPDEMTARALRTLMGLRDEVAALCDDVQATLLRPRDVARPPSAEAAGAISQSVAVQMAAICCTASYSDFPQAYLNVMSQKLTLTKDINVLHWCNENVSGTPFLLAEPPIDMHAGEMDQGQHNGCSGRGMIDMSSKDPLVLAFRGTASLSDTLADVNALQQSVGYGNGCVHTGFWKRAQHFVDAHFSLVLLQLDPLQCTSASSALPRVTTRQVSGRKIVITGHSLGGAVAKLVTIKLLMSQHLSPDQVTCITFGTPLVGDKEFAKLVAGRGWEGIFHTIVHNDDIVPRVLMMKRNIIEGLGSAGQELGLWDGLKQLSGEFIDAAAQLVPGGVLWKVCLKLGLKAGAHLANEFVDDAMGAVFAPFGRYSFLRDEGDGMYIATTDNGCAALIFLRGISARSMAKSVADHLLESGYNAFLGYPSPTVAEVESMGNSLRAATLAVETDSVVGDMAVSEVVAARMAEDSTTATGLPEATVVAAMATGESNAPSSRAMAFFSRLPFTGEEWGTREWLLVACFGATISMMGIRRLFDAFIDYPIYTTLFVLLLSFAACVVTPCVVAFMFARSHVKSKSRIPQEKALPPLSLSSPELPMSSLSSSSASVAK